VRHPATGDRHVQPWKSFKAMAATSGWGVALLYAAHRVMAAASRGRAGIVPYVITTQPLGGDGVALRPDPKLVLRVAEPGDPAAASFPRPAQVNAQRWAAGARCFVAVAGGEFAGHIWIQSEGYDEDEVRCRFVLPGSGAVWDFDVFVAPRFRLGRTMARLWHHTSAQLGREGARWSFSRISMFNHASIASHARLGAISLGRAVFVVVGPWQCMWSDLAPRLHLSLRASTRPHLQLPPPPLPAQRSAGASE
jgi:hypothetical protein